ncbi:MAG: efflux RND transporter permease subunit [Planctomycetota bacterium]
MILSDVAVRRPVLATVLSLVLVTLGIVGMSRLAVRELPDIDSPRVSISTSYLGAAAAVIETRVTQVLENGVSGIDGIRTISSSTSDGRSSIDIEFDLDRDLDAAANDVRDRVSRVLDRLPDECDPPEVAKVQSGSDTVFWMNAASPVRDALEITDYIERFIADQFSNVNGVAQVRYGGGSRYAMRIWLDRQKMAATGVTAGDIESALQRENVELPAGRVESTNREFTVRVARRYRTAEQFGGMVIARGDQGHQLTIADVARVEVGPSDDRTMFRRNGEDMVGIGIVAQAKANVVAVIDGVKERMAQVNAQLPPDIQLYPSSDSSVYIRAAIREVYRTLFLTALVVVAVIFLFLGSGLATMIPAVTVPVSLVGTFFVLDLLGFSINLLTLLGMVLAIGLVVDDAIVVLENVARRIRDGEKPLRAAFLGTRQVGFAVIATTVVLVAVLVPVTFVEGNTGRLFSEFALALAGAVVLSTIVAVTLTPVLCSLLLKGGRPTVVMGLVDALFAPVQRLYRWVLQGLVAQPLAALGIAAGLALSINGLYHALPQEYAPQEDRGSFRISMRGPEGASFEHAVAAAGEGEKVMLSLIESNEAQRVLVRVPGSFRSGGSVNSAFGTVLLKLWGERDRTTKQIMAEVDRELGEIPGYRAFTIAQSGLLRRSGQPVQFVLTGSTYEDLQRWRDVVIAEARKNPGFVAVNSDYEATKPQLEVYLDEARAADLGVSSIEVGRTLETMMGSRRVTTYVDRGEEYDVVLEAEDADKRSPADLEQIYVRSQTSGGLVPLANVVQVSEFADSASRNRYDRLRSITISANLTEDYTLGEALAFLQAVVADELDSQPGIAYGGQSREFVESSDALLLTFLVSLLLVYLVLAAQFESFLQPLVILLTVPLAVFGGLLGLYLGGGTINIYSQIGMVILIGLAAKNGILIVEFANQLRDEGQHWREAILEASVLRLRPILMTGLSTSLGALPLVLADGAGAEGRAAIGLVVLAGVTIATLTTLLVVPGTYGLVARFTGSPQARSRELGRQLDGEIDGKIAVEDRGVQEAAG